MPPRLPGCGRKKPRQPQNAIGAKNKIEEKTVMGFSETGIVVAKIKLCTTITKNAYQTNMIMHPGNSGSPVVDKLGRVIGVAFAIDGRTNYGYIVNLQDLKDFLARY